MQPYRHDKLQFLTTRAAMRLLCAIIVELLVFLEEEGARRIDFAASGQCQDAKT